MPQITDPDLYRETYEVRGHLYIYTPVAIFQARAVESYSSGVQYPTIELLYENVTLGDYEDIRPGMTVFLGTTLGGRELGAHRVKDVTISTIYVGWTSDGTHDGELHILPGAYITVFEDYRIWTKTPFIQLSDGSTYKDFNIGWLSATAKVVVANAGGTIAGDIDTDTGYLRAIVNADTSLTTAGTIVAYTWEIADCILVTGGLDEEEIEIDIPPGFRYIYLTVENSFGNTHTKKIPVLADDPEDRITYRIGVEQISRQLSINGQRATIRVQGLDLSEVPDGALVIYYEDEYYGGIKGSLNAGSKPHIKFTGWIANSNESASGSETGGIAETTLECWDAGLMLSNLVAFSQTIKRTASPTRWEESEIVNIDLYVIYLLYWHSTGLEVCDILLSGTGDTYQFPYLGSSGGNLFDQTQQVASAMAYNLHCTQEGILELIVDPLLQRGDSEQDDRTTEVIFDLLPKDILSFRYRRKRPSHHWLEEAALIAGDTVDATQGIAPGAAPGQSPQASSNSEQVVVDTDELLWRLGNRYARVNSPYSLFTIVMTHPGDAGIQPRGEWITVTLDKPTPRGDVFNGDRFLVLENEVEYDAARNQKVQTITAEWETVGQKAAYVEPATADVPSYIPPYTLYPPQDSGFGTGDPFTNFAAFSNSGFLLRTSSFPDALPSWAEDDLGLTGTITGFTVSAFSPLYLGSGTAVNGWIVTGAADAVRIYSIDDIFGSATCTLRFTSATIPLFETAYISSERLTPNFVIASWYEDGGGVVCARSINGTSFTETVVSSHEMTDNRGSGSDPFKVPALAVIGGGLAYVAAYSVTGQEDPGWGPPTAQANIFRTTDSGAAWANVFGDLGVYLGMSLHVPFHNNPSRNKMWYARVDVSAGHDNQSLIYFDGSSETVISLPSPELDNYTLTRGNRAIATNPTNDNHVFACLRHDTGTLTLAKSLNRGADWTEIEVADNYGCDVDSADNVYIWGDAVLGFVDAFGNTYEDKRGDMLDSGLIVGICGG